MRSKAVSKALFLWKRSSAQEARRQEQASTGPELPLRPIAPAPAEPPPQVLLWFNGLRKLVDIPFNYLVPREQMLPPESIRFFCIDRAWIASLLDGAASIGRVSRDDLDRDIGRIRSDGNGRDKGLVTELAAAPSGAWSGVLLRSSVVSGWPGLLVNATAGGRTCPPVRIDRLSPNILLAIFEGQFDRVSFHLQPELLHFGFDQTEDDTPKFFKRLRRADGVEDESVKVDPIPFPDAPTAARVFSASRLAAAMREAFENKPGNPFKGSVPNSAQFALQMIEGVPRVTFLRDDTAPMTRALQVLLPWITRIKRRITRFRGPRFHAKYHRTLTVPRTDFGVPYQAPALQSLRFHRRPLRVTDVQCRGTRVKGAGPPRARARARAQAVGLVVVDELLLGRVERELAVEEPGQRRRVAGDVRVPHDLRVGRRLAARLDAVEEVAGVGRDVQARPCGLSPSSLISPCSDAGLTSIPPLSPVSTQPSSPTNRTGQVPRWLTQPGRSPNGVLRKSSTSFTPLA